MFDLLTKSPPHLSCAEAERIADERFGARGSARMLTGERDQTFYLRTQGGREFVLKVANSQEDPSVTDFQTQALLHVATREPSIPVPRVQNTIHGATEAMVDIGQGRPSVVRLLTYVPGTPLDAVGSSPILRRNLGIQLAGLGRALSDFSHAADRHRILWGMQHVACLSELICHVVDADQRVIAERYVDQFVQCVLPAFPDLRWQVIYNDLNSSNVLVDPNDRERMVGIIDFGDIVRSPLWSTLRSPRPISFVTLRIPSRGPAN